MAGPFGLILAAGFGSRLGHDMPKALIPWGKATILDDQLDRLAAVGVTDVWVVVGFQKDKVAAQVKRRKAGPKVRLVENARFMDTNTAKSMLIGLRAMPAGGVVTLNGDVVFDAGILELLLEKPSVSSLAVDPRVCGDEEIKYRTSQGRLQELNKHTHGEGEAIGINHFCAGDRSLLEKALDYADDGAYFERGVEFMLPFTKRPLRLVSIGDLRAVEIDFPEDLAAARRLFG